MAQEVSPKKTKKKRFRRLKRCVAWAIVLAAAAAAVWFLVLPSLEAGATTTYESYTATRGDISNSLSFSGSISVKNSETLSSSSSATVRQIYVSEEETVSEGQKLLRLSNGETIKAGFDGQVNEITVEVGDEVSANTGLIQIVDFNNMKVSMRVDEYSISDVAVGQACRVSVTALNLTFDSEITHINRISASSGSTAYYTVTAELSVTDAVLPGMAVTVTIPQEEATDAVILSKSALSFDSNNSAYVLMDDGTGTGTMVHTPVTIGVDNDNYVEILSGLSEGDTVYVLSQKSTDTAASGLLSLLGGLGGGMPGDAGSAGPSGGNFGGDNMGNGGSGRGSFGGTGGGGPGGR